MHKSVKTEPNTPYTLFIHGYITLLRAFIGLSVGGLQITLLVIKIPKQYCTICLKFIL